MGLIVSICLSLTDHRSTFVTQSIVSIYLLLTQSPSAFAIRSFVKSSFLFDIDVIGSWSARRSSIFETSADTAFAIHGLVKLPVQN
jgi:hypothetical protein